MGRSNPVADGELKPLIRQALHEARIKPPLTADGWLRVSSLAGLCAREEVLCSISGLTRNDPISGDLGIIFEHGHALHWDLQNRVLPKTQTILGRWQCINCGFAHGPKEEWVLPLPEDFLDQQALRPTNCAQCKIEMDSSTCMYQEQWIKHPEFKVAGHPDAFLRIPGMEGTGVFEGKSINPRGAWEVRGCPKLDHVVQAQTYMWLTGCKWGKIVYWDKAGRGLGALIEHTIEYDEDHIEAIQQLIVDIWEGIDAEILPDRICSSVDCKRANMCGVAEDCFARN